MIALPPLGELGTSLWHVLLDLREATDGWTLVGGQMVLLLGLEHGRVPPWVSEDIDVLADVRARPPRVARLVEALNAGGFELGDPDPDGYAHRYRRDRLAVDLLASDNAGNRANVRTSSSTSTVPVSGGTYALQRSEDVAVTVDGRIGAVPRPDVAGALVIKARAAVLDRRRGPDRHHRDIAFLCSLVADPIGMRAELGKGNRRRIALVEPLRDSGHEAWVALGREAGDAYSALQLITGVGPVE